MRNLPIASGAVAGLAALTGLAVRQLLGGSASGRWPGGALLLLDGAAWLGLILFYLIPGAETLVSHL